MPEETNPNSNPDLSAPAPISPTVPASEPLADLGVPVAPAAPPASAPAAPPAAPVAPPSPAVPAPVAVAPPAPVEAAPPAAPPAISQPAPSSDISAVGPAWMRQDTPAAAPSAAPDPGSLAPSAPATDIVMPWEHRDGAGNQEADVVAAPANGIETATVQKSGGFPVIIFVVVILIVVIALGLFLYSQRALPFQT